MDNFEVFLNDENEKDLTLKQEFYKEAEALGKLNTGYTLSDEEFVTKFVLAEQICRQKLFLINLKNFYFSDQLSTNPIIHKFCVVPSRNIFFASYIFSVKNKSKNNAIIMNAFSLILPCER